MTPKRMQRPYLWTNRPPGAVDCGRGNIKYGNPFDVKLYGQQGAVDKFRTWQLNPTSEPEIRFGPKGTRRVFWPQTPETLNALAEAKWLACYCKPDEPCHCDVLIELLANRPAHLKTEGREQKCC